MSLTSTELNYLVWRYLQESGFDLAAYALEKHSHCSSYEHDKNLSIVTRIEPGCLVNLVQKGILFSLVEEDINKDEPNKDERLSLLGALLQEEINRQKEEEGEERKKQQEQGKQRLEKEQNERFILKSEVDSLIETEDVEMKEVNDEIKEDKVQNAEAEDIDIEFTTKEIIPQIKYSESLITDWHPSTDVYAYGKDNSTAVINAINNNTIAESVTLNHPNILNVRNEINVVSWAPQGSIIVTVGIDGELRAWSPDGKLKNIANTFDGTDVATTAEIENSNEFMPAIISNLVWSENGHYLLSIDINNQVCLWDGNNLNLIQQIIAPSPPNLSPGSSFTIDACWLDESKFAISTPRKSIKIYTVAPPQFGITQQEVQSIGYLNGHENYISILKFNPDSKLLASCSDFDYVIKVWSSSSTQESLNLNTPGNNNKFKYHTSPILGLYWLDKVNDDSVLLSVSMEGVVNIWNAVSGESLISTNIFKNLDNYKFNEPNTFNKEKDVMVFNSAMSPNSKWLAIGDDLGRISIWDVSISRYSKKRKEFLRCLGVYNFEIPKDGNNQKDSNVGICDLSWDSKSSKVSVSYKGSESVIFNWD